jgi:TPR repeat protein
VARGLSLCEEAAKAGDINAMTDLGNRYLMGSAVPRDIGRARVLYEAAAAKGQANAASTLGQIYWNGDGVPRDNAAAAKWWRIAYDGGRTDAAEHLGNEAFVRAMDREKGMVNVVTLSEAGQWYRKALAAPLSAEERGRVENYLSMITQELNRLGK